MLNLAHANPERAHGQATPTSHYSAPDDVLTDTIVAGLYSAAAGREKWEPVLAQIGAGAKAWAVQLMGVDKRGGSLLFSHMAGGASAEGHLDYITTYHRMDPRAAILVGTRTDGWMHCHNMMTTAEVDAHPFYQDFLIPYGGRYVSGTKVVDDDEMAVVLGVHRGWGSQPLEDDALAWLTRIRGHLVGAMAVYRQVAALQMQSAMGHAILDALRHPVVLVDASRLLRYANPAARQALAAARYITDRQGLLCCRRPEDDNALAATLMQLAPTPSPAGVAPGHTSTTKRFLRIHTAGDQRPIGVCVSHLQPAEVMGAFGTVPLAMLVFHDSAVSPDIDPYLVAEIFGLTPAEARVAVLLVQGKSAETVAQERGVSMGTVRSQIKTLLAKTGARKQSDLVRIVMSMSVGP